jgi:hypothetical protein
MANIKGFITIPTLTSNTPGQTSPVGELSALSRTYAREVGFYTTAAIQGVELNAFVSTDVNNSPVVVADALRDEVLSIAHWTYDQIVNGAGFPSVADLALTLTNTYSSVGVNFTVGQFVVLGLNHFPEWLAWDIVSDSVTYHVKIWFADAAFRTQFKDYTITVIPPTANLDLLFGNYTSVYNLMQARTLSNLLTDAETAKAGVPYTHLKTVSFDWVNAANVSQHIPTVWGVLIYGEAGNNDDNIRNAISTYILANSTHTLAQWKTLLPSLFASTEVIVTPLWDRNAIANQTLTNGLYSATIRPADITTYALATAVGYDTNFVTAMARSNVFTYKSLAFTAVGSAESVDGITTFDGRFPDYMAIPSTSLDFQRMAQGTQDWILLMNQMLPLAEVLDDNTDIPNNMSTVVRGGKLFLSCRLNNVLYLVAAKSNFV